MGEVLKYTSNLSIGNHLNLNKHNKSSIQLDKLWLASEDVHIFKQSTFLLRMILSIKMLM